MPKYRVVLGEVASYEIEIEAKSQAEACDKAEETMVKKGVKAFQCEVHSREVDHIEVVRKKRAARR